MFSNFSFFQLNWFSSWFQFLLKKYANCFLCLSWINPLLDPQILSCKFSNSSHCCIWIKSSLNWIHPSCLRSTAQNFEYFRYRVSQIFYVSSSSIMSEPILLYRVSQLITADLYFIPFNRHHGSWYWNYLRKAFAPQHLF